MLGNSPGELALENRDLRQRSVVPPERLAACHALVVGVGAVGRQVALQLAAVGVPRLTLFDDDRVAVENLAPQGYWVEDLGLPKVQPDEVPHGRHECPPRGSGVVAPATTTRAGATGPGRTGPRYVEARQRHGRDPRRPDPAIQVPDQSR